MSLVEKTKLTVWYDSSCPLCLREIAFLRKLDRRGAIDFIDIISDADSCPISPETMLARFHAQEVGQLLSGAAAFAAMWRAIPILRPLGLMARNRWMLARLENLYIFFLRHRPRLQRWVIWMEGRAS